MTIALPTRWIWDSWYVRDGDLWHAFFLQADKSLGDPDLHPDPAITDPDADAPVAEGGEQA